MKSNASEQLREALRRFMELADLTVAGWARRAGLSEGTLRNFLAGTSDTLTHASLAALASAVHQPVSALLGEMPLIGRYAESVPILYEVDVAKLTNNPLMAALDQFDIYLPSDLRFPGANRFGAIVRDDSACRIYPKGSIAICVDFADINRDPMTGDHVLVAEYEPVTVHDVKPRLDLGCRVTVRGVSINENSGITWLSLEGDVRNLSADVGRLVALSGVLKKPEGLPGYHHFAEDIHTVIEGLVVASYSLTPISHLNTKS